jgi:hypothetical protein
MTPEALAKIREWDTKCGQNELVFFGTTIDRRRLLEYVDELTLRIADLERQLASDQHFLPAGVEEC